MGPLFCFGESKMKWRSVVAALLGAILTTSARAGDAPSELAGKWAVRTVGHTYAILSVDHDVRASGGWRATLTRPQDSYVAAGGLVGHLGSSIATRRLRPISEAPEVLRLAYADPDPDETTDVLRLTPLAPGKLLLTYEGGFELLFDRARPGEAVATDWDGEAEVPLIQLWPDNAEMAALFEKDQADRTPPPGKAIDWSVVGPADVARRARAQAFLDAGALHSGADYFRAAFLFQHGKGADDYLKAHALAVAAAARGYRDASWIAAASLDRYLRSIGRPQVFGTQFKFGADGAASQDPYDRALLSDGLRAAAGVPSLALQQKQREEMEAQRKADAPKVIKEPQPSAPSSSAPAAGRSK